MPSLPGATPATPASEVERDRKLKKACADFESMLVYQLLKTMRQTIPKSGSSVSMHGRETYEMMLDQKMADVLAQKKQGTGLQQMLYNQISRSARKKD